MMNTPMNPQTPPNSGVVNSGVDIDSILSKVKIDPQFKPMYDKAVLSGLRIMFDPKSHKMMEEQLAKEGPMPDKIAEGIVTLYYMLLQQSNKTLAPQLAVPVCFTLAVRAFEFLQTSGNPEATQAVLGDAIDMTITGIMKKYGVAPEQIEQFVKQNAAAVKQTGADDIPGTQPTTPPPGILGA